MVFAHGDLDGFSKQVFQEEHCIREDVHDIAHVSSFRPVDGNEANTHI